MADEPHQETDPEAIRQFRGQGWMNVWGVLLLLFLACAGICLYVIATAGFSGAIGSNLFGFAAFFGGVLGLWLIGRRTVPYLFTKASSGDPRTTRHAQNRDVNLPGSF